MSNMISKAVLLSLASVIFAAPAFAQDAERDRNAFTINALYKGDVMGVASGGVAHGVRFLDNIDVVADADLEAAFHWKRATAHFSLLNNLGGRPNDLAGSIQGIDNIEVSEGRLKVYEAWLEQGLGEHVMLKTGLYDVNSEFYQNDAAGLLISPMFGVGSELAATGTNGPAIFPSTALAVRLKAATGNVYGAVAVVNAKAGTIGDEEGIDFSGREGALVIAEAGWTGRGKLALGAWRYTHKQPGVIPPGETWTEERYFSQGLYLLAEQDLLGAAEGDGTHLVGFVRLGLSDGRTTPFRGGWQSGVLWERPFASRPASAVSLGAGNGALSRNYRAGNPVDSPRLDGSETIFELTYSDEIIKGISVQPDIQYVLNPSADSTIDDALVLGLRFRIAWSSH